MLSDWAYALSPLGRLERTRIREARRLPELALRAAAYLSHNMHTAGNKDPAEKPGQGPRQKGESPPYEHGRCGTKQRAD